jgi:hypothetical protein
MYIRIVGVYIILCNSKKNPVSTIDDNRVTIKIWTRTKLLMHLIGNGRTEGKYAIRKVKTHSKIGFRCKLNQI